MSIESKNRAAIIYLPNGQEIKFSTTKDMAPEYKLAKKIEGEPDRINIVYEEDGKDVGESYVMIPYLLQLF